MPSPNKIPREKLLTFLSALGLFFAVIEYLLPKPVPFMRLGISNLPLVLMITFWAVSLRSWYVTDCRPLRPARFRVLVRPVAAW